VLVYKTPGAGTRRVGIVTAHQLDTGRVERGKLSLVPSYCVVSELIL